jgi:hypothetical protein
VEANSGIFLFKKAGKAGNKMGGLYALDKPHLFIHVPDLLNYSCY